MGKREAARAEARFVRGETGVDGQSTAEETRDAAEVEKDQAREQLLRGRTWLGREFLTWLLWKTDPGNPLDVGGEQLTVHFTGRTVLRGLHGEVVELMARGALAPYSVQVKRALADGLLVHACRVRFTREERTWEAGLDAEHLDVKSAKLPDLLSEEDDERITERLELAEQLSGFVDALVGSFLKLRASKAWGREAVPAMRRWMEGREQA